MWYKAAHSMMFVREQHMPSASPVGLLLLLLSRDMMTSEKLDKI